MYYSKGTDGVQEFMLRRAIDEIDDRLINDGQPPETRAKIK